MQEIGPLFKIAGICVLTLSVLVGCESSEEKTAKALEAKRQQAEKECNSDTAAFVWSKNFIGDHLKAPATADFPFSEYKAESLGNCTHRIGSYVDSQNIFGAKVRTYYVAVMQYDRAQDHWTLLSVEFNNQLAATNWYRKTVLTEQTDSDQQLPTQSLGSAKEKDEKCEREGASNHGKQHVNFGHTVKLPPVSKRKIIGTWGYQSNCTISFEVVGGATYRVIRCQDCSGGTDGIKMTKESNNIFRKPSNARGEFYQITTDGNLGSYDRDGLIDTYPKHVGRWP